MKKNKKIFAILCTIVLQPLLCSAAAYEESISLEWHVLTKAIKILDDKGNNIEANKVDAGGIGHSFVVVRNNTSSSINVGYYSLKPNSYVSVGLWTSSSIGSSSNSSSTGSINGVLYDYESAFYTYMERPVDELYVSKKITKNTLNTVSNLLKEKNDDYNLMTYNCATFSTHVWNEAMGTTFWTGWFRQPSNVVDDIKGNYKGEYVYNNYALTRAYNFYHYNKKNNTMVSYNL